MKRPLAWRKIWRVVLALVMLCGVQNTGAAKELRRKFDRVVDLGVETTQAFLQDRDGFLWFGTAGGGLFRYDGYDVKQCGIGPDALLFGTISSILEDRRIFCGWAGFISALPT